MKEMKNTRKLLTILLIALMSVMLFTACGEDVENKGESDGAAMTCSVEINCSTALNHADELSLTLPENGIILSLDSYEFHEGDTAFDVFKAAMDENDILFELTDGIGGGKMLNGINNLYNGDCGDLSGWMFIINDEMAMQGADATEITDGDKLLFAYSCDCGEDLGFTY